MTALVVGLVCAAIGLAIVWQHVKWLAGCRAGAAAVLPDGRAGLRESQVIS